MVDSTPNPSSSENWIDLHLIDNEIRAKQESNKDSLTPVAKQRRRALANIAMIQEMLDADREEHLRTLPHTD